MQKNYVNLNYQLPNLVNTMFAENSIYIFMNAQQAPHFRMHKNEVKSLSIRIPLSTEALKRKTLKKAHG